MINPRLTLRSEHEVKYDDMHYTLVDVTINNMKSDSTIDIFHALQRLHSDSIQPIL